MTAAINADRFASVFQVLTSDGRTEAGGLDRPAFSATHLAARSTWTKLIGSCGFEHDVDRAGNVSAIWNTAGPEAPVFMLGSHLDSVPNGGRFDGALGVAAAFEVLQALRDAYDSLPVNVEVIDFTDEEGTWVSLCGSRAVCGLLSEHDLANPRGDPERFEAALDHAGLTRDGILAARRAAKSLAGYLELHIEQGRRLETAGAHIGVVTGMVGIHMYLVTFGGRADHAGTTPMADRQDATLGASMFSLGVRRTVTERFTDCVATVGNMQFEPGSFNIVAEQVTLFMEFRTDNPARGRALELALHQEALRAADTHNLNVEFSHLESVAERAMDPSFCRAIESAAHKLGMTTQRLPSLAGHDAQSMASLCPAGMIFVPSRGGFSHSASEHTAWEDCVRGARVLLAAAERILGLPEPGPA